MADFEVAAQLLSSNGLIGIHDTYPRNESFVSSEKNGAATRIWLQKKYESGSQAGKPQQSQFTLDSRLLKERS